MTDTTVRNKMDQKKSFFKNWHKCFKSVFGPPTIKTLPQNEKVYIIYFGYDFLTFHDKYYEDSTVC